MTTLQERMALAFPQPQVRGLQADIAKLCMVKPASVSAWFKQPEKVASISRSHAELICRRFNLNISPAWLAEEQGDMLPATATATLTAPTGTLSATGSASKPPLAQIEPAQGAINGVAPFGQTLQGLAYHLANVDASKREAAIGVMTALMRNPDDLALLSALTTLLVPAAFVYKDRVAA